MPKRPNIVLTIADDQRFDTIAALGNSVIRTPGFDRMVHEGLAFTAAHHMGSLVPHVCAPSRAMLLTGRSLFRLPDALISGYGREEHPLPFLPQLMRESGYHTHGVGKWHNGKPAFARSFDSGENIFFGGMCDHHAVPVHNFDPSGEYSDAALRTASGFSTDIFADSAIRFLENHEGEEPFFLFVAFTAPHDPRTPPAEYASLYAPEDMPLPPSCLPCHPFDNGELGIRDELLEAFPRTPQAIQRHLADYYAMISHLDSAVDRIHRTLERCGRAADTLVIHTADHGLAVGGHGLMGKQNLYEHSIRVPLVLRGPGVPRGRRSEALCYQHDLFPTLCEAAGLAVPESTDFQSLSPLVANPSLPGHSALFSAYRDCQRMVKDDQWKLIEYAVGGERRTQLFDWRNDPHELQDLAASPEHFAKASALHDELGRLQHRLGDPLIGDPPTLS